MIVCATISIPWVFLLYIIGLSDHGCKLSRRMSPLKTIVHVMITIKSLMTELTTNLTRAVWGTTEIVGEKGYCGGELP
jgi:hypothetical protein